MRRDPAALARETFDLLIIGGGILGAGVARDAALRGLRVALVEKGDFAGGTSSRSSKLIHGGFRYLEQFEFGLVAESCRERQVLQRIAPQRVRPLPFLLPVYEGDPRSLFKLRLGMTLYDLLALYRNTAPHRTLKPEAALAAEPSLNPRGLRGAILYYDCQEDDARFCVDNILHAAELGACCANYCEVTGFVQRGSRIAAAQVKDRVSGGTLEISARLIVNAAGPWVERVAGLLPGSVNGVALSPTKGVHLLLPRLNNGHAVCFQARRDGRIMFLLPWHDCSLLGTTDTDFRGDPDDVHADPADVRYLLDELSALIPGCGIDTADIITTFAGVRALLRSDVANPSARSRDQRIVQHGENLLSVAGGKYTTYRAIAEQVVDRAYQALGQRAPRCRTAQMPLPDYCAAPAGQKIADCPEVYAGDVVRACEEEMALSVADVMYRRTGLGLSRFGGRAIADSVAQLMAPRLGWTESQMNASLQEYVRQWRRGLPQS